MNGIAAEDFWTWTKIDTTVYDGYTYLDIDMWVNFERELWFELGNWMWRKHRSVYQDHMMYVRNYILKPFKVKTPRYAKRMHGMHDLAKYLTPPSMKGEIAMTANWSVRNEEFTTSDIRLAIKDGLQKSMRDELDDHTEDYRSLTYADWCDLLSIIKVKYERKRAAVHIKKIASVRAASKSDSDESARITRRKKAKTVVLSSKKSSRRAHDRHHGVHC